MSIERVKNSTKSFIWMMVSLVIVSVIPFILRTVMIRFIGEEYVGLNSLFTSILQVLSITELGLGDALVFYLYKPVAEKNVNKANEILNLYKTIYRIIGCVLLGVSIILIPFLQFLIKGDIPNGINIYCLYFIYILDLLIPYFFNSYCLSIFQTNQSLYHRYKSESFIWISVYLIQIILLVSFRNYYGYVLMIPVATVAINICTRVLSRKHYPMYFPSGTVKKEFIIRLWEKVSSMALMKVRDVIRFSLDSVVISAFLGLIVLAQYNNYYMILEFVLCL